MPFTPFHWAVAVLGFIFFDFFYLPALLISSVLMDVEPFYYLFIDLTTATPIHGVFHTYLAVTIMALVIAFLLIKYQKQVDKFTAILKIQQPNFSREKIIISSLAAAWSHIFLDSFLYSEMKPFWPLTDVNPFLWLVSTSIVYSLTGVLLVAVLALWLFRFLKK